MRLRVPDRVVGLALAGLRSPVRPTSADGDGEGSGRGAPAATRKQRTSDAPPDRASTEAAGRLPRASVVASAPQVSWHGDHGNRISENSGAQAPPLRCI